MTTYATGNPLGSTAVKDLYDNAENIDFFTNGTDLAYPDRFGVARKSWAGMEADFQQFLLNSGYEFIGDYDADGPLMITARNQIFTKDGEYWRAAASLTLPYTTVNNWVIDEPKFVSVGDAALRQDLATATLGSEGTRLIGHSGRTLRDALDRTLADYLTPAQQADAAAGAFMLDLTTPIATAFADLQSGAIKTLTINTGWRFKVTDGFALTGVSRFAIKGKGEIRQFAANKRVLYLLGCDDFEIRGPRFYGLGTDFTPLVDTGTGDAIYAEECTNFKIHFSKFTNFGSAGVRTRDGSDFEIDRNTIIGTHGLSASIAPGDLYQFGIICQSNWDVNTGPARFSGNSNKIRNVAIGVRVEPKARDYSFTDNELQDIKGNHGFYLNGQDISVLGNRFQRIEKVCIKAQSFYNALGPTTDPIRNLIVAGNRGDLFESGVSIERTGPLALKNADVSVTDNQFSKGATAIGAGIIVQATEGLLVDGNVIAGGRYGMQINEDVGTTDACSGKVSNNFVRDTFGAAYFGNTDSLLEFRNNQALRPCLAVAAGPVDDAAFYLTATTALKRIVAEGNVLVKDTSLGVSAAIRIINATASYGDNDLDGAALDLTGTTVRQRNVSADFVASQLWGASPNIGAGARSTITIVVAGVLPTDRIAFVHHASDLQGCVISADAATGGVNVTISNVSAGAVTIADGTVTVGVMRG